MKSTIDHVRIGAHRRRALAALAVGACSQRRRRACVRHRHRQSGHPDALGQHAPLQPRRARAVAGQQRSSAARTSTTATAISTTARSSPTASTCCRSSTSSIGGRYGFRVSAAGWYDDAYQQPRQHEQRDRQHAGQRPAGRRRAEPLHQALRQGLVGRVARRVRVRELRRRRRAGQRQGGPAHRVLGRQPAARRRDPRRVVRTEFARRLEGLRDAGQRRRRSCSGPRGGLTLQAQPTKELSVAGQWFYNWQADRIPESGSYLTIQDPLNFGGDSFIFGPNPLAASIPGAPALPAPVAHAGHQAAVELAAASATGACRRAGVRSGSTARWASTTAIRPTSFRRRWRRRASLPVPAAVCSARGGIAAAGGTLCFVNPQATTRRRPAEVRQARHVQRRLRRQHPHLRRHAGEEHRRRERRRGAVVSPEHAARERPGAGAARGVRAARARFDRDDRRSVERHAGRAGRHVARRSSTRVNIFPQDAAVRHGDAGRRAHLDAVGEGDAERGGVQGARATTRQIDKRVEELRRPRDQLHADVVPGVARASTCSRR